jgi:hypothetical protein
VSKFDDGARIQVVFYDTTEHAPCKLGTLTTKDFLHLVVDAQPDGAEVLRLCPVDKGGASGLQGSRVGNDGITPGEDVGIRAEITLYGREGRMRNGDSWAPYLVASKLEPRGCSRGAIFGDQICDTGFVTGSLVCLNVGSLRRRCGWLLKIKVLFRNLGLGGRTGRLWGLRDGRVAL